MLILTLKILGISEKLSNLNYRPQRSCEGYVFTGMCLYTVGGIWSRGGAWSGGCGPGGGCLLLGGVVPWGVVTGGAWSRGLVSQHAPPGETATAEDGTHPTGMHSCVTNKMTQE